MLPLRDFGLCEYAATWREMRRCADASDFREEVWTLEHPPVYTLGQSAVRGDILRAGGIPVVESDRGGRATYHGPGQAVAYVLADLRARKLAPKRLVVLLQDAVLSLLRDEYAVAAEVRADAPGVYVEGAKIAALGLRVRRGRSYHGVSLNADCDLRPFQNIHPCGFPDLRVIALSDLGVQEPSEVIRKKLGASIARTICSEFPLL